MKILVLSDSHSALSFMRRCIQKVKPDAVIHLGDYYDDGEAMAEENPNIRFHQVPGNCDRYRSIRHHPEILCYDVYGVKLYMTHGHLHGVKQSTAHLITEAARNGAQAVLYGHTHIADCYRDEDGMWVMNPGACGSYGGSAGILEVNDNKITACYLIRQADLEGMT